MRGALILLALWALVACDSGTPDPVIYTGTIVTMDDQRARAQAIAVIDGRIAGVGTAAALQTQFPDVALDTRFSDKVIMPGFVEPHLHPYIVALLLPLDFITPHPWNLPGKTSTHTRSAQGYAQALRDLDAKLEPGEWLKSWGYHHLFHGPMNRQVLDQIVPDRPAMIWHRSFHEIYLNSAALEDIDFKPEDSPDPVHANVEKGHFYENGLMIALPKLVGAVINPFAYVEALDQGAAIIQAGGITTVGDGAFGSLHPTFERWMLRFSDWTDAPFDTWLLPDGKVLTARHGLEDGKALIDELPDGDLDQIRFSRKQVKFFADGAAYSLLMKLSEPYSDGHEGVWLMEPDLLEASMTPFWRDGYQIHIHVNGDYGLDVVMDIIDRLQSSHPRTDHRTTIHHLAYARPDQAQRMKALGLAVSANPYYVWALSDVYAREGLGEARANAMVPLRSLADQGISIALHSDFTMAPAHPLLLAWSAVTRATAEGNLRGTDHALTLDEAMAAITREAAWQLGQENEIGTIETGKRAHLTVLDQDPWAIDPMGLKDIPIHATMHDGTVFLAP